MRQVSRPHPLHRKEACGFGGIEHLIDVVYRGCKRFFDEDGLARVQRQEGIVAVAHVRRGDVDDVDVVCLHQLFVASVGANLLQSHFGSERLGARELAGTNRDDLLL